MRDQKTGQITIEYFLLLAVIVVATLGGLSTFHEDIAKIFQRKVFKPAVDSMPLDDKGPADPDVGGSPTDGDHTPPEPPEQN